MKKTIDVVQKKQRSDRRLLRLEIFIGFFSMMLFFVALCIATCLSLSTEWRVFWIIVGLIPFLIAIPIMLRIEQIAGFYQCKKCNYKHIPSFKSVCFAMHMGRTRYLMCPRCKNKSWHRKTLE